MKNSFYQDKKQLKMDENKNKKYKSQKNKYNRQELENLSPPPLFKSPLLTDF